MGDGTGIEWTDATWNPTLGCEKVSPGCDNCYAIGQAVRCEGFGTPGYEPGLTIRRPGEAADWTGTVRELPERLEQPLRWTRPRLIFVDSMSDLFHHRVSSEFVAEVWAVMALARHHRFQLLTKRPGRMPHLLNAATFPGMIEAALERLGGRSTVVRNRLALHYSDPPPYPLPNVWVGTSIEGEPETHRANRLRSTPAAVRWISAEPLLGPLPSLDLTGIDWLVAGGESGRGARPMHPGWVRDLRDRCEASGTAFLFKQWGNYAPIDGEPERGDFWLLGDYANEAPLLRRQPWEPGGAGADAGRFDPFGDSLMRHYPSKRRAGRELDGLTHDGYPDAAALR